MPEDEGRLIVSLARQLRPGEVVFTGANSPQAVAACLLARRAYGTEFTLLTVAGAVDPAPALLPASSGGPELLAGSAAIFANEDCFDLCARGRLDTVLLGAAQVDARGRANVSAIGDWRRPRTRLPGGGGAAMMMPTARRAVIWATEHSRRRLVESVDFATAAGAIALVTPLATFGRPREGRFRLETFAPETSVGELRERTGFEFDAAGAVAAEPLGEREREALAALDVAAALDRRPHQANKKTTHTRRSET